MHLPKAVAVFLTVFVSHAAFADVATPVASPTPTPTPAQVINAPSPTSASVPFQLVNGHIIVDARINGQGPFSAIIDDGSQEMILDSHIADQIGLHPTGVSSVSGVAQNDVKLFTSNQAGVSVAGQLLTGQTLFVTDMHANHLDASGHAQMIIGQALFTNYVVTIDFIKLRLSLSDPATYTPDNNALTFPVSIADNGIPLLAGTVNDAPGVFQVDLGSNGGLILYPGFVAQNKSDFPLDGSVTNTVKEVGGSVSLTTLRGGATFKFGDVKGHIPRVDILGADPVHVGAVELDGNFGLQLWLNNIVSFDIPHKQILLQKPQ